MNYKKTYKKDEKFPVFETEMLIKQRMGIVLRKTYWSDGSTTEIEVPKGPILIYQTVLFNLGE